MKSGLQTHINGWVDPAELAAHYTLGVRVARIDAMESTPDLMLESVHNAEAAGMEVIPTLADPAFIALLHGNNRLVECRNEDDGDMSARAYRKILDEFCAEAAKYDVRVLGGVGSNTDDDTIEWGNEVRDIGGGWPATMYGVSWHTYGPYPHLGFKPRPDGTRAEFEWLLAMVAGLPLYITEFGVPNTGGMSEQEQADYIAHEWKVIADELHPVAACLFQCHDGKDPHEDEDRFGIRRCNAQGELEALGIWKPVAYTFPLGDG